jgi:hypothetical protein
LPLYIKSSQEIAEEKYADRIAAAERKRLKAFEDGLNSLESLGITDDRERLSSKAEYHKHAEKELRRLMTRANLVNDSDDE